MNVRRIPVPTLMLALSLPMSVVAEDGAVFSGPQVGEKLAEFKVQGVYDGDAGKQLDYVASAAGKPVLIVFVHQVTRPSIAVTRMLMDYASTRTKDGLNSGVVFLSDDQTATQALLKRARHAMPKNTPIGISVDGVEGPGSYGLNRKMTLTILVGKENRVTANFALVQPSVQADVRKVVGEVVKLVGGEVPTLEKLGGEFRRAPAKKKKTDKTRPRGQLDAELQTLLRALIQKTAKPEDVKKTANDIEEYLKKHETSRARVGEIAQRIIAAGKLKDYGTPPAQAHLKKWAAQFGSKTDGNTESTRKNARKNGTDRESE